MKDLENNREFEDSADLVFAADGAFSAVRYNAMQKVDRFNYSQFYVEDGYKELLLPANENGNYQIEKNAYIYGLEVDLCYCIQRRWFITCYSPMKTTNTPLMTWIQMKK